MRTIQQLDHAATLAALPTEPLCAALLAVLRAVKAGQAHCPVRTATTLPDGAVLLAMSAADADLAVVKLVTVHPHNPARGLPAVQAHVSALSAASGERVAELDGEAVTARRTAALSLVATRLCGFAPSAAPRVLVLGGGVQAQAHISVLRDAWPALELRQITRSANTQGQRVLNVAEADLAWADLIVTATSSATPLFTDAQSQAVRPNAMVCAVGAYNAHMAELPPALVRRSRLVVDRLDACRTEAGDLVQARVDFYTVADLTDLVSAQPSTAQKGPTIFKSVGSALWDLAAARCALRT